MTEAARRYADILSRAKVVLERARPSQAAGTRDPAGTRGTRSGHPTCSSIKSEKTADFRQFSEVGTRGTPGTRENHKVLLENRVSSAWGLTPEEREAGLRRLNGEDQHNVPEAEALAQHYAAPAEVDAPAGRDPLAAGLLRGFYAHRQVQEPYHAQARAPRVEACSCCGGTRWWQEARNPTGWRCWWCHPGDHLRPEEREERQG